MLNVCLLIPVESSLTPRVKCYKKSATFHNNRSINRFREKISSSLIKSIILRKLSRFSNLRPPVKVTCLVHFFTSMLSIYIKRYEYFWLFAARLVYTPRIKTLRKFKKIPCITFSAALNNMNLPFVFCKNLSYIMRQLNFMKPLLNCMCWYFCKMFV